MDQTGSQPDEVSIELYGGPLDGMSHAIPRQYFASLGAIKIVRPCNYAELEKIGATMGIFLPQGTSCQYIYIFRQFDNRFVFQSSGLQ